MNPIVPRKGACKRSVRDDGRKRERDRLRVQGLWVRVPSRKPTTLPFKGTRIPRRGSFGGSRRDGWRGGFGLRLEGSGFRIRCKGALKLDKG